MNSAASEALRFEAEEWATRLFQCIDDKDLASFQSFLLDDVLFRFGNAPVQMGKPAAVAAVDSFFDSVRSLRHEPVNVWSAEGSVICHGTVTYTRHDGTFLTVPFANVFRVAGDRIREYLIFVDVSELFSGP